jgi:hypothetical protein
MRARLLSRACVAALVAVVALAPAALADDYGDPDYLAYDLDNMARTTERQGYHLTTADYMVAAADAFRVSWMSGVQRQVRDLAEGRLYAGVGQLAPGGNVGDPEIYFEPERIEVEFINREGTKLVGNVWPCADPGRDGCPGVVITTGSIQVTQHMYGWLTRHLQANGYTVLGYDVRGQGESETTTDGDGPFRQPANPQDGASFNEGTVDALRFLLSTPDEPYVPVGMDEQPEAAGISGHNPAWDTVDPGRLALIGHSLGASAVSTVQQCTDAYGTTLPVEELPDACAGQHFPIRAIVAYDSLSAPAHRLVPALDHQGDGYFVNAVPTPSAPDPDSRVSPTSVHGRWRAAGQDACVLTVRGGTHAEWSEIPGIVSATRYGVPQAAHYTLAWLDRYVSGDPDTNRAGFEALRDGPVPAEPDGEHLAHRASLLSGKYRSACYVTDPRVRADRLPLGLTPAGLAAFDAPDLRAYAGVAPVGDWAALNAEREYGHAQRGALHDALLPAG